jgi:septal ring-binding cell division protein DamX
VTDGEPGTCPRCGARVEPGQEYCLECGLRLPGGGLAAAAGSAWRRRLGGRTPPDWLWPVVLGLLLAALMTGVAIWISRGNDESSPYLVETGPNTVAAPPTTAPTEPTTTAPTETEPTTPTTTEKPKPTLVEWPQSQNGYAVVIASIPRSAGREVAIRKAQEALRSSLPEVGVIDSGEFSSLHPGYYVVFSGIYDDQRSALAAVPRVQRLYPAAYIRQISH